MVDFQERELTQADIYGQDLAGALFNGIHARQLDFSGRSLEGAQLFRAHLHRAKLAGVRLNGANCFGAEFNWADLQGASLERVNLREAVLCYANLRGAWCVGARFGGASLFGADLRANLDGADLVGSFYDHETIFPEGFNPLDHGMEQSEAM